MLERCFLTDCECSREDRDAIRDEKFQYDIDEDIYCEGRPDGKQLEPSGASEKTPEREGHLTKYE